MEYWVFSGMVILFILIIFMIGMLQNHKEHKQYKDKLKLKYGTQSKRVFKNENLQNCRALYEKKVESNSIDEITWNDLNLEKMYQKINFCESSAGDEYLYYLMRTPIQEEYKLEKREQDICYYMEHEAERIKLQFALHLLGRTGKYSIHKYIDNLEVLGERKNTKHWLMNVGYFIAIGLLTVNASFGIVALVALMVVNIISYFKIKAEIEPYLISFSYILRLLHMADKIKPQIASQNVQEATLIENSIQQFKTFKRGAFVLSSNLSSIGTGNPLEMLMDYCRMCFHIDIIKFNQMLQQLKNHKSQIEQLLQVIGYLDSIIAIGCYRQTLEYGYCTPVFQEGKGSFVSKELYHPMIKEPIKNDTCFEKSILITGSNASGKSTFLKAIALNSIFAQTIHTCFAKELALSFCHVISSMSLKDSLESGESYYIVEIKSIKRMLEKAKTTNIPVFCFVDEVLRGTNTVERIAAATEILKAMSRENTLCFAATHDIELTTLLEDDFHNYHFEEEIEENDIKFSYKLLKGSAKTRNAIKLLQVMGYGDEMIQSAERLANGFLSQGIWKKG